MTAGYKIGRFAGCVRGNPVLPHFAACNQTFQKQGLRLRAACWGNPATQDSGMAVGWQDDEPRLRLKPLPLVRAQHISEGADLNVLCEQLFQGVPRSSLEEPEAIEEVFAKVQAKYGSVDAYLDGIGFGAAQRQRLRDRLTEEATT